MNRRDFVKSVSLSTATASALVASGKDQQTRDTLKRVANRCAINVGVQTSMKELQDPTKSRFIVSNFNIVAAGNEFKWTGLRPTPDTYNFSKADWIVDYVQDNHLQFHGHNLCWNANNPPWLEKTLTKANAEKYLTDHIAKVMKRYAGKVSSWDVVNEPVWGTRPDGLYNGPWLKTLGPQYIDIAFHAAQAADSAALRVLNLHHVEQEADFDNQQRAAALSLLKGLLQRNVPVQAVGLESHLDGSLPARSEGCVRFVKQIKEMGLQVLITELDVNDSKIADRAGDVSPRDQQVASDYSDYLLEIIRAGSVNRIIFFAIDDRGNWYDSMAAPQYTREGGQSKHRPSLLDENMQDKPAYSAVRAAFSKACAKT